MQMQNNNSLQQILNNIRENVVKEISKYNMVPFIPTGALEPVIKLVGQHDSFIRHINLQCNNKQGKSAMGAQILKNIMWEYDRRYFDYKLYREWPYVDNEGRPIKRARIIGTSTNVADSGPIRDEIKKWWPKDRYVEKKHHKSFFNQYETDTGWLIDVMTFDQDPDQFEGPLISFHWVDEPPPPAIMGAITSRYSNGGITLFTQTPINAGPFLDLLDDLKERGADVITYVSNIWENSSEDGPLNSLNEKRGLMTNEQIQTYIAGIPPDEAEERIWGKNLGKSGKVYKNWNSKIHVLDIPFDDPRMLNADCYIIRDPHPKYYPAIQFWAVLPPNKIGQRINICYNEWPDFNWFKNYYDEVRTKQIFNISVEDMSKIIKVYSMINYGYNICDYILDPRYEKKFDDISDYLKFGIEWKTPPAEKIEIQRNNIGQLLKYDPQICINIHNQPLLYVMSHCKNTIRCFDRHYWEPKKNKSDVEKEAEKFKDFIDCTRMFRAWISCKNLEDYKEKKEDLKSKLAPKENYFRGKFKLAFKQIGLRGH